VDVTVDLRGSTGASAAGRTSRTVVDSMRRGPARAGLRCRVDDHVLLGGRRASRWQPTAHRCSQHLGQGTHREPAHLPILDGVLTDIGKPGMRLVIEVHRRGRPSTGGLTADLDQILQLFPDADVDLLTTPAESVDELGQSGDSASRSPPGTPSMPSSPVPRTDSPTPRP